jgi:hypothetical protein
MRVFKGFAGFLRVFFEHFIFKKVKRPRSESNREAQKSTGLKPVGVPLSHGGINMICLGCLKIFIFSILIPKDCPKVYVNV